MNRYPLTDKCASPEYRAELVPGRTDGSGMLRSNLAHHENGARGVEILQRRKPERHDVCAFRPGDFDGAVDSRPHIGMYQPSNIPFILRDADPKTF